MFKSFGFVDEQNRCSDALAKVEALLVEKAKLGDELERALRSVTSQQSTISQHEAIHKYY